MLANNKLVEQGQKSISLFAFPFKSGTLSLILLAQGFDPDLRGRNTQGVQTAKRQLLLLSRLPNRRH